MFYQESILPKNADLEKLTMKTEISLICQTGQDNFVKKLGSLQYTNIILLAVVCDDDTDIFHAKTRVSDF